MFHRFSFMVSGSFLPLFIFALAASPADSEERRPWLASSGAEPAPLTTTAYKMPATVRVRILHTKKPFSVGCTGIFNFMPLEGGKVVTSDRPVVVKPGNRQFIMGPTRFSSEVVVAPIGKNDFVMVNRRRYRGAVLLEPVGRMTVDVVEQLPMDDYLYGVLPREVGGDWPIEALKAQAVVSRTYVLANLATDPRQRYDVSNDVSSQVYGGLEDEAPAANKAVEETRGEYLLTKQGKPLEAFFHSSCGGRTETPNYVWKSRAAEEDFSAVKDSYCRADPYYRWQLNLGADTLRNRLKRAGVRVGAIRKISIAKKTPSDRAWVLGIYSDSGTREMSGQNFRMAIGPEALRSTLLTEISRTKRGFHFEGRGWGHGVGLCQWGAKGRAQAGQSYYEIVKAYYPDVSLVRSAP